MGRSRITWYFLIFCICSASMGIGFTCKEAERKALLNFKRSFFFDESNSIGSWVGGDCCSWKGVGCDNLTGNVIKLDVRGYLNSPSSLFAVEVSPALLELKYLRYLDLSANDFNWSRIPEFLGSMRQLEYLNLSNAVLSGKVPCHLGNLTKLVVLDLSRTLSDVELWIHKAEWPRAKDWQDIDDLMGIWHSGMEINNIEWASKLENLQYLDLSGINMSQAHDSLHILHKLPSLSVLILAGCRLGNSHQVISNSTASSTTLQHLDLHFNLFSGSIPHFIQNLRPIRFLDLSLNQFNSSPPSWFGNKLVDLKYLSLGYNSFNGPFPYFIQNLSFLTSLDLSYNQFSSSIPSWLANKRHLEFISLSNNLFHSVDGGVMNIIASLCDLKHMDLSYNQLQEDILEFDANFSRCSRYHLQFLYMQNNNMSGQLPTTKYMLSLQELDLSHNNFEVIPASFGELFSLESADLSYNKLSVVRQVNLANLSSLKTLDISSNSLDLHIASDWLPPFQLESLHMLPCKINSQFPQWILSQRMISELDLSHTGIFGSLPSNIGNAMPFLWSLRLANNSINGSIPRSLCKLAVLQFLDLQQNRLSGNIPDCWVNSQILGVELSSNKLSGHIPNSLTKYGTLQLLSLGDNLLEGELPISLSNCTKLMVLDVGKNNLHGKVPSWNGANFTSLQILILRENRFNGVIPPQLCTLHTLQIIDLANNDLVGTIPPCFGHFEGMGFMRQSNYFGGAATIAPAEAPALPPAMNPDESNVTPAEAPAMNPDEWSATEVINGRETEYTTVLHLLVNMDLSCNNLVGVIPANITSLSLLVSLNLSYNHLMGTIPKEIGKMRSLESLDLSFNNLSGSIPESISYIYSLSRLNLSFNNLQGQIPTGSQLQTLVDPSIYMGNPRLCGDPLPRKCFPDNVDHPSTVIEDDEEEDSKHEKMWFYLVIMLGFAIGFWGVIGTLVANKRWRHAFFLFAEDLADWLYVRVAVGINRAKGGR